MLRHLNSNADSLELEPPSLLFYRRFLPASISNHLYLGTTMDLSNSKFLVGSNQCSTFFPKAHNFQVKDSYFVNGDQTIHYGPRVVYTVKGPIGQLQDYYFVASQQEGSPGERVDIVRRFDRKEDRDAFESLLQKTGFVPFSMQPLWRLSVYGAPCLTVSSALYTLQEMMDGEFPSFAVQDNVYLKITVRWAVHFFSKIPLVIQESGRVRGSGRDWENTRILGCLIWMGIL
ncbi:hypothetical protein GYMLUDRAFT_51214 [Collybiopsis luxurians FD-317 M1]|uniref:Uncharacterized protein n=1 Tax=Collybiopsis luxurians FD-317 M1 TaxID=944289 RepID=A0A0D0AJR5_9AGAR|nr:hypothetical protein GYMLUDRAFT_51214 [Collybiopsis luxurians FD-317 M1]